MLSVIHIDCFLVDNLCIVLYIELKDIVMKLFHFLFVQISKGFTNAYFFGKRMDTFKFAIGSSHIVNMSATNPVSQLNVYGT